MGVKVTKPQNTVTKFTLDDEQRPPTGMPNVRDAAEQINFLSVPTTTEDRYPKEDSSTDASAETTTLLSSKDSSSPNLTTSDRSHSSSW